MSIKAVVSIIVLQGIIGMIFYTYFPDYGYIPITIAFILGIIGWFSKLSDLRKKSNGTFEDSSKELYQDDGEYENDFSKVPAGISDPIQPPPRSIVYGTAFGVDDMTLNEDLERIGIEVKEKQK